MIAYLLPGQGAQTPGFLHALADHPAIARTLDEAGTVLGTDVRAFDTAAAQASTEAVQVSLLVAGVATARALAAEGLGPDLVAGLSVGAFAAAVICGSLDFADALRLVCLRGRLMAGAYPSGHGLAAVVGLDERQVGALLEKLDAPVFLANLNAPRQIVVAGSDAGLAALMAAARAAGAHKVERLAVSVPSHCVLLQDAAEALAAAASQVSFQRARIPYIGNRRARALREGAAIRDDMTMNLRYPVRWHEATALMVEMGARVFVEMPPGQALSGLIGAAFEAVPALALEHMAIAEAVAAIQARARRAA
jgi:malonate decarboxylase epsilon subunit